MIKKMKKMINKLKKHEENCNVPFLGFCLHHWKQKWCKMIKKNDTKNEKMKNMIKIWLKSDKKMIPEMIKKNEDDKINDKKWWM